MRRRTTTLELRRRIGQLRPSRQTVEIGEDTPVLTAEEMAEIERGELKEI